MIKEIFAYSWNINDKIVDDYKTEIRIWGIDNENKSTCLIVKDFKPYLYVEV